MAIIGNILLLLAALFFIALTSLTGKPMPGGDAGVGYAWALIIYNLGFIASMILAALCAGQVGAFEWVAEPGRKRFLWVAGSLLATLFTYAVTSALKHEPGPVPGILRALSTFAPFVIPVILIGTGFILMNSGLRAAVPLGVYKWPLVLMTILGVVGATTGIGSLMLEKARRQAALLQESADRVSQNDQRILGEIDSCDVMKSIYPILIFTGDNQPAMIRDKAVAKIKTNPAWEDELVRMLEENGNTEVFQFLASNDVTDPARFIQPINQGILHQAASVRERIRGVWHSSNFYSGMFGWETEWVLRTVEKYEKLGGNYLAEVKAFRAAMDEPSDFEKTEFTAMKVLDKWIRNHK